MVLIVQHKDGFGHTNFDQRYGVAESIRRIYQETGVIVVPAFYTYEVVNDGCEDWRFKVRK